MGAVRSHYGVPAPEDEQCERRCMAACRGGGAAAAACSAAVCWSMQTIQIYTAKLPIEYAREGSVSGDVF